MRHLLLLLLCGIACGDTIPGSCTKIPLINAAWHQLPADLHFPCDSGHLIVVPDYAAFLTEHTEVAKDENLRERGRLAFAFSISAHWPIYINIDKHAALLDHFNQGGYWIAYAIAGVLAHERVHALGNLSESAGLLAELRLDERFQKEGKLPKADFDVGKLRNEYLDALAEEKRRVFR